MLYYFDRIPPLFIFSMHLMGILKNYPLIAVGNHNEHIMKDIDYGTTTRQYR